LAADNRTEQDENREMPQLWLCSTFRSRDRDVPHAEEAAIGAAIAQPACATTRSMPVAAR
jgi:hypothetical protein